MPDQSSAATEHAILQEITRPLEALPDDPLARVNAEFPSTLRGYDRVAVDEYVRQTRRLVAELQATRSPESAVRRALERVGEQISGILQRAHETAEQITAQSRSEAEDRLEQARVEAAGVASAAEQRVRDLDADTDRIWLERQRIVADAEDLAGQLLALAKTAGERFPADAEAEGAAATPPYDDEHDAPAVVAQPSFAAYAEDDADDADDAEDVDDAYLPDDDRSLAGSDRSEIERTVAFRPLKPSERASAASEESTGDEGGPSDGGDAADGGGTDHSADATAENPAPPSAPGADASSPGTAFTDDDSTAVIPPASQAANRRRSE